MADLVTELERLRALRESGDLTEDEFARAKARLLDGSGGGAKVAAPPSDARLRQRLLAVTELQGELEALNHRWEGTKNNYANFRDRSADDAITQAWGFLIMSVVVWMGSLMAIGSMGGSSRSSGELILLLGVVLLLVPAVAAWQLWQALEYGKEWQTYEARRNELLQRIDEARVGEDVPR
jgi:hypothetical protein